MAVPRKRKKLAEKPERQKKQLRPGSQKQPSNKRKAAHSSSKKIDEAFKIMTTIEDKTKKRTKAKREEEIAPPVEKKEPSPARPTRKRMGFRVQVSLDALMPNRQRRFSETRKKPVEESQVIDIDLTIPFLWDIPIIGGMTKKFFKNFKTIKL